MNGTRPDGEATDAAAVDALHHTAHEKCVIANSVSATIRVEPR